MAIISPFRAWRYNPERVPVQQAVTQPYDKITPAMQDRYYEASPYNLVRIILGRRQPEDSDSENVYTRSAASFENWRQTGILRQDSEPSLYRYSQTFTIPSSQTQAERQGFIGLGRIEEYSSKVVFRHEQTLAKPKADRLELLRANRGHFGQLFMLYSGGGEVDALLHSAITQNDQDKSAEIEITDEYSVVHRVWKISDADTLAYRDGGRAFLLERYFGNLGAALAHAALEIVDNRLGQTDAPLIDLRPPGNAASPSSQTDSQWTAPTYVGR